MNWPIRKLGEVATISSGNSAPQDKKYFINGKYPFFRTSDVGIKHIDGNLLNCRDKLNDLGIKNLRKFSKGTILFPKSGASTFLNHRAMLGVDGFVSSHLATIKANSTIVMDNYLYYLLLLVDARKLTADQNYPSLNLGIISTIEIPVPPLKIQKKIIERLDTIRKAQELNDLQISKTEELFESVLNKLVINSNFPTKKLGDIAQIISGQSPKSENYNKIGDGLPLYQGKRDFGSMFTADPAVWTTEKTKVAKKDDILISVRAPVGPVNLAGCQMNIGRGLAAIRPWEDANYLYLFYYLRSQEKNIAGLGSGSTFQSVNRNNLENLIIPTPPLKEQQKIVEKLNAVQEYKKPLLKQKDLLKELFESVLDKSIKGENENRN